MIKPDHAPFWEPGRLVSLLHMLKLSALSYLKLGYGAGLINAMVNPKLPKLNPLAMGFTFPEQGASLMVPYLESMRDELAAPLGAKGAVKEIERLIAIVKGGGLDSATMLEKHNSIYSRIEDELDGSHFLYVEPGSVGLFNGGAGLFGDEVAAKFPSLSYDIGEAGKCLALERSTASAFHSLRCLEGGIKALSRCLGIPDPIRGAERNWGVMLRKVKEEIERRWKAEARLNGDGQQFEDAHAALAAMQNPWRNATMHLEQTYTEEEAEHLLRVAKDFLKRLARRMDEDGEPKA